MSTSCSFARASQCRQIGRQAVPADASAGPINYRTAQNCTDRRVHTDYVQAPEAHHPVIRHRPSVCLSVCLSGRQTQRVQRRKTTGDPIDKHQWGHEVSICTDMLYTDRVRRDVRSKKRNKLSGFMRGLRQRDCNVVFDVDSYREASLKLRNMPEI